MVICLRCDTYCNTLQKERRDNCGDICKFCSAVAIGNDISIIDIEIFKYASLLHARTAHFWVKVPSYDNAIKYIFCSHLRKIRETSHFYVCSLLSIVLSSY